ncbi:MAG: hypothetical protein Q4D77_00315 [Peptostreptococcaceae bacterium]|nr:hypothetical protein [Peptostreptococcaceae bacterium]
MKKYNPSSHRLPKNLEEWIDYLDKFFGKDISSDSIDSFISSQDVKKFRLRSEGMELEKEFFKNFRKLVTGNDALLGKLPWFLVMLYHWNKLTEAQFKDYILKDLKSRGVKLSPEMEFDKILHLLSSEHSALYPKKKIFSLSFEELQKFRAIILTLDTPMIHLDVAQTSLLQEYFDYYVRIILDEDFSKTTEWNKAYKEQIPGLTKRDVYSKLIPYFIYNNQTGNWLDDIFKVIVSYYSFSPYSGHNDGDYGETKKCIDSFVIYQYPQLEANNEIPNSENEDSAIPHDRTASYQYAFLSDDTSTDRSNQKINEKLKPFRPLYDKIYFDLYNSLELETTLNGKELKSKQEKFAEEKFNNILRYAQNTSKIVYDHYPSLFDRYAVNIETHPDCFCKPDGINYAIPYTSIIDSTIDRKYHHTDFEFIDSVPETVDPKNFYQNHLRLETQMPDNSFDWAISYFNKAHKAKEKIIDPNNTSEIKIVLHHFDPSKSWDEENKRFIMEFATLDYFTGNARRNLFESFLPTPVRDRKSDKQIDCAARYKNKAQKIQEREELLRYTKNECLILLYLMHWIYHQDQHQGPTPEESFLWNNNIIDPTEQHKINGTLKRHFGSLDPETLSKITLTIRKSFSKIAPSSKKLEDHKIHGYSEKKAPVYDKDTLERKFNEDKEILMTCNSQAARRVFIDKYGEKIFTNTQLQDLITWIREESYRYMEKYYIKEALENDGDHFKINTTGTSFAGCGTWILTADMDESGKPRPFLLIDKRWHVSEDPNKMTYPTSGSADYYDKAHKKEWVKGKEEKDVSKFESIRKNHLSRNPFFTAAVEHYEELGLNLEGKYYKESGFENPESEMSKFVQKSIDKLTLLSFGLDRGRNVQQFSFYYKSNKTVLDYLKAKSSAETSKEGKLFFIPFKKDIILTFLNNLQIENQAIYSLIKLMELEEDLLWKDEH